MILPSTARHIADKQNIHRRPFFGHIAMVHRMRLGHPRFDLGGIPVVIPTVP